jgi:glucokinase
MGTDISAIASNASNEKNQTVLGIDLGGTAIKLGRFTPAGDCIASLSIPTPKPSTPDAVVTAIVQAVKEIDPAAESLAIGLGTPGPVDDSGRIAKVLINLAGWHNVPLADLLEEKTGKFVAIANDANCAGLGEAWLGAGKGFKNFLLLTLGTGVGGAVILDGQLFTGHSGSAGELGLITINLYGPECNSGNRGSLEQYVAIPAIRRQTGMEPDKLGHMAEAGNRQALEFWETYGHYLGAGLANLIYVLDPEAIAIGGGISASAEYFLPSTRAEIERRVLPECRSGLQLLPAQLGNQAGMVGAAKLAWQLLESRRLG